MKQLSLKCVFNDLRTDSFQNIFSKEIFTYKKKITPGGFIFKKP